MASSFPVLTLEGSPQERGEAHGRLAADRIRDALDFYGGVFDAAGVSGGRLERAADRMAEEIGRFDADMLVELEGIAHGADVSLREVVSLNARSELMRLSADGCTAIASLPDGGPGHTLLAQNWDWHPSRSEGGTLMRILPDDGPAILTFAEAGALARCGLNEHGVGVVGNALECEGCTSPGGVPVALLRRRILGCATLAEAVAEVRRAPRGTSANHLIATAEGEAVSCEATPDAVYEVPPVDGLLAHSNHFLSSVAGQEVVDTGIAAHPDTLRRAPRVRALVAARRAAGVAGVQEALSDHDGHPDSICRHATAVELSTWTTVASVVMDLDRRRMWVAAGPPCEGEFDEHPLEPVSERAA
jgi:isopenicillin-N N-acyltransferase-like protein